MILLSLPLSSFIRPPNIHVGKLIYYRDSSFFFRPPDIVVGELAFYQAFFFLLLFCPLIFEFAEQNSTMFGHMVGSKFSLRMHVLNLGYPIPLQIVAKNRLFWTTSQLNGKFNGLYLPNETWCIQSGKCIDNYKGLLHRLKTTWTLVHKRLQTGPPFYPPSENSAYYKCISLPGFVDGDPQTQLKQSLPNGGR